MSGTNGKHTTPDADEPDATPSDGRPPRPRVAYRDGWEANVPADLKARRQWVVWSYDWREPVAAAAPGRPARPGKWTKVLYQPDAPVSRARSNAPKTWDTFDLAVRAWRREPGIFDGVGFVFDASDPFCGVDFDACLDADGRPLPWAADLLALTASGPAPFYREVSPSGVGVKVILRASLGDRKGTVVKGQLGHGAGDSAEVGIYDRGRFFAVTGAIFGAEGENPENPGDRTILEIGEGQQVAEAIYGHIEATRRRRDEEKRAAKGAGRGDGRGGRGRRAGSAGDAHLFLGRAPADDEELLARARSASNGGEFSALYDFGRLNGYPSESEADGALCCHLAYWTQKDAARMERLWLASALGRRDKVVGRPEYRTATIATAIEKTANVYRPLPSPPMPAEARGARAPLDAAEEIPWTDEGLAERIVRQHGHQFRYCKPWKKWLVWDETRWRTDDTHQVDRFIKATIRRMQVEEAATIPDKETREAFHKWAVSCESKRVHEAALSLLRHQDGIPVVPDQLDANPWLLNCPNGTVDLTTGRLRPHDRHDLITKLCPVEYHPDAAAPLWDEILTRFLPDDGLRAWADRLFGYALTGTIREHLLAIFYGLGANGKTTILNALYHVMGTDYALKAPPDLLMQKKGQAHPTERASLFGKRLVIAAETGEGERFDESFVKELTGDEPITARRMREDFWSFPPTHKIILATNHKPSVKGSDNGIWRRLKLVEFGVSLGPEEQDTSVPTRLRDEYPGILARAVASCLEWQRTGLVDSQAIIDATKEYKDEEDTFGMFLDENCTQGPLRGPTKAAVLYSSYKMWAQDYQIKPVSLTRFGKLITAKGIRKKPNNGIEYHGIELKVESPQIPAKEGGSRHAYIFDHLNDDD